MEKDLIRIGRKIRNLRTERQWSQAELAEKAGLSPQYICQVETGKKRASLASLIRISAAFDVPIDTLTAPALSVPVSYYNEFSRIIEDCTPYEKQILLQTISELKRILKENRPNSNKV